MAFGYELREVQMGGNPVYLAHSSAVVAEDAAIGESTQIHAGAVVEGVAHVGAGGIIGPGAHINGAVIGDGVRIGAHTVVLQGAEVGAGTIVGQSSVLREKAIIGQHSRIQDNVHISNGVELEEAVFVGAGVVFPNDRQPRAFGRGIQGKTRVGYGASIGANSTVLDGGEGRTMEVGDFSMLAAGSVATKPLLPFGYYVNDIQIGWVDALGNRFSDDTRQKPSFDRLKSGFEAALREDSGRQGGGARVLRALHAVASAYIKLDTASTPSRG